MEPKEITDLDLAFPANVIDLGILPKKEDIPKELWDYNNEWNLAASTIFCRGAKHLEFKDGVDVVKAKRQLHACLSSFEPSHEHKLSGVGWLLSHWLKSSKIEPYEGK
jgi:hypothetical protein